MINFVIKKALDLLEFLGDPAVAANAVIDLSEVKKAADPEAYAEIDPTYKSYLDGVRLNLAKQYPDDPEQQAYLFDEFIGAERRKITATLTTGITGTLLSIGSLADLAGKGFNGNLIAAAAGVSLLANALKIQAWSEQYSILNPAATATEMLRDVPVTLIANITADLGTILAAKGQNGYAVGVGIAVAAVSAIVVAKLNIEGGESVTVGSAWDAVSDNLSELLGYVQVADWVGDASVPLGPIQALMAELDNGSFSGVPEEMRRQTLTDILALYDVETLVSKAASGDPQAQSTLLTGDLMGTLSSLPLDRPQEYWAHRGVLLKVKISQDVMGTGWYTNVSEGDAYYEGMLGNSQVEGAAGNPADPYFSRKVIFDHQGREAGGLISDDTYYGTVGSDLFGGEGGNDTLHGFEGVDHLYGDSGDDVLIGGKDGDTLVGGTGKDMYIYQTGDGYDFIEAYGISSGDRDVLQLKDIPLASARVARQGNDLILALDGGSITVRKWFVSSSYRLNTVQFSDRTLTGDEITKLCQTIYGAASTERINRIDVLSLLGIGSAHATESTIAEDLFKDGKRWTNEVLEMLGLTPSSEYEPLLDPANLAQLLTDVFTLGARTRSDPLVLDLNGDGFSTIPRGYGPYFDLDVNGFMESTGWVAPTDGLVVRDLNGNGVIDDGAELFGDQTVLPDGSVATNGFQAVASIDSNLDGKIDNQDEGWSDLRVWLDRDGDGISSASELLSMDEAGVAAINTGFTQPTQAAELGDGNAVSQFGSFVNTTGDVGLAGSLLFNRNTVNSLSAELLPISEEVAALPDITAMGNVHNLSQAMVRDAELVPLVTEFMHGTWENSERAFQAVLYRWTGADTVAAGSRGEYVDAKHLTVLEQFYGQPFINFNGGSNPDKVRGLALEFAYYALKERLWADAMIQTHLAPYFMEAYVYPTEEGQIEADFTGLIEALDHKLAQNQSEGIWALAQVSRAIHGLGLQVLPTYAEFEAHYTELDGGSYRAALYEKGRTPTIGSDAADSLVTTSLSDIIFGQAGADVLTAAEGDDIVAGDSGSDTIYGGSGADTLLGGADNDVLFGESGDDVLDGGDGDDILSGGSGTDVFRGGQGNDTLGGTDTLEQFNSPDGNSYEGGQGNDILRGTNAGDLYLFNLGDGADTLHETLYVTGLDILQFGEGIRPEDWQVSRESTNLVLNHVNGTDSITIVKWFHEASSSAYRVEEFRFADGTIWTHQELTARGLTVIGTPNNDVLKGVDDFPDTLLGGHGNDILYGYEGDDLLEGGDGADELYGDQGSDQLFGGSGNDKLFGGSGDDLLDGGDGDDLLNGGTGKDVFRGGQGNDTLGGTDTLEQFNSPDGNSYEGGQGNDILRGTNAGDLYLFNLGDGADTLHETLYVTGLDILQFGEGIRPEDWQVSRESTNLVLKHVNGTDSITIVKWYNSATSSAYRVEEFRFEDGTVWTHEELTARGLIQQGTASAETITGFGSFSDLLFGGDGNDTLRGMASGDLLLGQAGNDILDGAAGYDVVAGGAGNDTILAAEIVFFNKGDGADRINSYGTGRTTISVGQADLAELSLVRSGQDVRLQVGDDSISMTAPGTNALSLQVIMTDGAAPDIKVFDLQGMVTFLYSQDAGHVMAGDIDFGSYQVGEFSDAAYGGDLAVSYAQTGTVRPLVDANPSAVHGYLTSPNANQLQLLGGLNSPS